MFREMRRQKQAVSAQDCQNILAEQKRGVLSVAGDDGYPYGVVVDYYYDASENVIYFHSGKKGHKMDAIAACDKVCFTTWNTGFQDEGSWVWNVTSVVCFGRASIVSDDEKRVSVLRKFGLKYYPSAEEVEEEIRQAIKAVQIVAIHVEHMTGKLVNES